MRDLRDLNDTKKQGTEKTSPRGRRSRLSAAVVTLSLSPTLTLSFIPCSLTLSLPLSFSIHPHSLTLSLSHSLTFSLSHSKQGTENAHVPARQALQAQKKTYTSKTASGSQVHYLFLIAYGEFGFSVKRLEFRIKGFVGGGVRVRGRRSRPRRRPAPPQPPRARRSEGLGSGILGLRVDSLGFRFQAHKNIYTSENASGSPVWESGFWGLEAWGSESWG